MAESIYFSKNRSDNVVMLSAKIHSQALAAFLAGESLRNIALEIKVSKRTLERWCSNEQWVRLRKEHRKSELQNARLLYSRDVSGPDSVTARLFDLLRDAYTQHRLYFDGELPKSRLKYTPGQIGKLALAVTQLGNLEYQQAILESFDNPRESAQ